MKRSPVKMKRISILLDDLVETMAKESYPQDKQFEVSNFASLLEKESRRE